MPAQFHKGEMLIGMTIQTRELLGPAEAARRLDVTPNRVRQLARAQILPALVLSDGRLIFTSEAVARLANERAQENLQ